MSKYMNYEDCPRESCNGNLSGEKINDFYRYENYLILERVCDTCEYTINFHYKYKNYVLEKPVKGTGLNFDIRE